MMRTNESSTNRNLEVIYQVSSSCISMLNRQLFGFSFPRQDLLILLIQLSQIVKLCRKEHNLSQKLPITGGVRGSPISRYGSPIDYAVNMGGVVLGQYFSLRVWTMGKEHHTPFIKSLKEKTFVLSSSGRLTGTS
jgi:hypothetical protein